MISKRAVHPSQQVFSLEEARMLIAGTYYQDEEDEEDPFSIPVNIMGEGVHEKNSHEMNMTAKVDGFSRAAMLIEDQ